MLEVNFWQDKSNSQKVVKEKKFFEDLINSLNSSIEKLNDFEDLNELALKKIIRTSKVKLYRILNN